MKIFDISNVFKRIMIKQSQNVFIIFVILKSFNFMFHSKKRVYIYVKRVLYSTGVQKNILFLERDVY